MHAKTLMILGMHRSGTSLVGQWLHKCGLNLGDNLMTAHVSNKDGHFEDMDFYELHEEIFEAHSIPFGGFENINNFQLTDEDRVKLTNLIHRKLDTGHQWGWKEPRTCLFVEDYLQLLPDANILVVMRDYNAVINSLINRHLKPIEKKIKERGRFGDLSVLKYKWTKGRKHQKDYSIFYAEATIAYYKHIYNAIANMVKDKYHIIEFEQLTVQDSALLNQMDLWGFNIEKVAINTIIKEKYITSSTDNNHIPKAYVKKLDALRDQILSLK